MELINSLQGEISILIGGWITIIAGLLVKDLLTNFMHGIMFYFDKNFNEGDVVYIDDKEYIIVKNGVVNSVFLNEKTKKWMYIRNSRLQYLRLEKDVKKGFE